MSAPTFEVIMPPGLAAARANLSRAQRALMEVQGLYDARKSKIEPTVAPDQEQPEISRRDGIELAELGIELAEKEKEEIRLEKVVVEHEKQAGILSDNAALKRRQALNERHIAAGDTMWRHTRKKMRYGEPRAVRLVDLSGEGVSILALYQKCDGQEKAKDRKKREKDWRSGALDYYDADCNNHKDAHRYTVWCHIEGAWISEEDVKAAHIVPFFLDAANLGPLLFGDRSPSLQKAGNALFLSKRVKTWFDSYFLVVVPVDAKESPITRWRTDVISDDIQGREYTLDHAADELHGKELKFLNGNRPVSRFLYFHFMMALVRIRDLDRCGWQSIWARYYTERPFASPGKWMSKSLLLAIATYQGTVDVKVVESFITEQTFDLTLSLNDDEAREAARRVHLAIQDAVRQAEKGEEEEEGEEGDEEEDDEEDEEKN